MHSEILSWDDWASRIVALRGRVWKNQDTELVHDIHDTSAIHFGIIEQGKLAACARLSFHNQLIDTPHFRYLDTGREISFKARKAALSRMVVHPDQRGQHLCRILDEARVARLRQSPAQSAIWAGPKWRMQKMTRYQFRCVGRLPIGHPANDHQLEVAVAMLQPV